MSRKLVTCAVFLLGSLCGCNSQPTAADATGQDLGLGTEARQDPAGRDAGPDPAVPDAGDDAAAGKADSEFAAYCQGIVDAFRALYENLETPENLMQEVPPPLKTGGEFDPNEFLTVLDRLHLEEEWTLDFTYFYASDMGGEPTLVARPTDSPLCQSDPEQPCVTESVWLHVLVDGTREGWFQLMVLKIMGDQFYREWHGFEAATILPSQAGLTAWLEEEKKHLSPSDYDEFDAAAMAAIEVDPLVEVLDDRVQIGLVYFTRWEGIVRRVRDISVVPPYAVVPGGENSYEVLFECTWCGVP